MIFTNHLKNVILLVNLSVYDNLSCLHGQDSCCSHTQPFASDTVQILSETATYDFILDMTNTILSSLLMLQLIFDHNIVFLHKPFKLCIDSTKIKSLTSFNLNRICKKQHFARQNKLRLTAEKYLHIQLSSPLKKEIKQSF